MAINVIKIRIIYDEATQSFVDVYSAPGISGQVVTVEVPREDQEPRAVERALMRAGADLGPKNERHDGLAAAIATELPVVHRAAKTGWNGPRCFVGHNHVSGTAANALPVIPPKLDTAGVAGRLKECGDLVEWRKLLTVAQHSTAVTIALCCAFAAPLLTLLHLPSFALMLFGRSRCGKSFAQLAGGSVIGFGTEKELPNLNATPAGLLAAALTFNDFLNILNEVGTARGPKRDAYIQLRDTTYHLMDGSDVIRHPTFNAGAGGAPSTFSSIVLLSSELSPDAWAARHGEARDEGETARLIGVPVLYDGATTVFDRPPAGLEGEELIRWVREQFARLRGELPRQRGVAIGAYADHLTRRRTKLKKRAKRLVRVFEQKVVTPAMSPVARDIVTKFGVLYAGGVLAVEAGILPLDQSEIRRAVKRACCAAVAELPDQQAELNTNLATLCARLQGGSIIDLDSCSRKEQQQLRQAEGFRQQEGLGHEFVIRSKEFESWFPNGVQVRRLLERLDEEGFLRHQPRSKGARSNDWAQKQVSWPDKTRVRSYVLFLPHGPTDLTVLT